MKIFKAGNNSQDNSLTHHTHQVLPGADIAVLVGVISLLVFPTWRRGGAVREYMTPYLWMVIAVFFVFLLSPIFRRRSECHGKHLVMERIKGILRDPVFYIGGVFLVLLLIQWLNSGQEFLVKNKGNEILFSSPPIDWLPGAVDTLKSWDMLVWFFPAVALVLMVRHGNLGKEALLAVYWSMVMNAVLLGIIGLITPHMERPFLTWNFYVFVFPPSSGNCFSTFGYVNHAASFFLLHLGLACGLFFHYYTNGKQYRHARVKTGVLFAVILFLFYVLHRCHSSYGMIFSWMIMAFFVFYGLYVYIREAPARKAKSGLIFTVVIALLAVGLAGLYFTAKGDILSELSTMKDPGRYIKEHAAEKLWYWSEAVDIWRRHPVFGAGGGSYSEYLRHYTRTGPNRYLKSHAPGGASVHNDFIQFLCEFGIVGVGLLTALLVLLVVKIVKNKEWKRGFVLFGLLGISGVLLQSMIDVPFRNPSVIVAFVVILAVYGDFLSRSHTNPRRQ